MTLPEAFLSYTKELMGEELFNTFMKGIEEETPTSIRINPHKTFNVQSYFPRFNVCTGKPTANAQSVTFGSNFKLQSSKFKVQSSKSNVPWCRNGFYLETRPNFTFDPLLHAGVYYVQEASSMFLDLVLRTHVKQPVTMLDACAAPGGKTTCAMSALPEGSVLFSNEPMHTRANILAENIQKYGNPNIIVTNNYPRDYKKTKLLFDVILTDVPCSGEGMFRKDQGAIDDWSSQKVEECAALQRSIVEDLWDSLRPGGLLIYSTCTFNAHEDEENVEWIAKELGAELLEVPVKEEWNITGSLIHGNNGKLGGELPVYRFIPGKTKGEGLFMAVMRKGDGSTLPYRTEGEKLTDSEKKELKKLKVLTYGIAPDTIKGKNVIPDHSKALSILPDKDEYPKVDIDWKDAIDYLRKEAIVLPADAPRGIVLLTYKGFALGFAKNLGNRANNLYPQEWRIKSTHVPKEELQFLTVELVSQ